jgi:hypothetical protein
MKTIAVRTFLTPAPASSARSFTRSLPARPGVASDDVGGRIDWQRAASQVRAAVDGLSSGWRELLVLFRYEGRPRAVAR